MSSSLDRRIGSAVLSSDISDALGEPSFRFRIIVDFSVVASFVVPRYFPSCVLPPSLFILGLLSVLYS